MTFSPQEFLQLADQLGHSSTQESEYRTVIYLAYYGLFLQARDALGVTQRGGKVHSAVSRTLRRVAPVQADALNTLRRLRNDSSYDMALVISQQDAHDAIALARVVESELRAQGIIS